MRMTRILYYFLITVITVGLVGCDDASDVDAGIDEIFSTESGLGEAQKTDPMQVLSVRFSSDHKFFHVFTGILRDLGPYSFTDTTMVTVKTKETIGGLLDGDEYEAKLVSVKNTEGDEVAKRKIKVLALVDLAQPQEVVDMIKKAVREIHTVFTHNNFFVAFMYGKNVSETMEVTDYVLDTYFKSEPDEFTYLYRSILLKKREMEDHLGVWADAKKMGMVIFSDEKVYGEDDEPIDPNHFELQQTLIDADSLRSDNLTIFAVALDSDSAIPDDSDAQSVLKVISENTGGLYLSQFRWIDIKNQLVKTNEGMIVANEFIFENPDGKVYRGSPYNLRIDICSNENDSVIGSASTSILMGSVYNPVIVGDSGTIWMFLQGLGFGLLILLLVYLIYQFLIPYIQYRLFEKKYVVKYVQGSMSVGNITVGQSCYFCKAPFQEGEDIVVKCQHVMHKSCWDENGYHCPEYGRHCHEGSHYYNYTNLFDPKNASFYMKWILVGIVAAFFSWLFYMLYVIDFHRTTDTLVAKMVTPKVSTVGSLAEFNAYENVTNQIPEFGLFIGFFLTLALSVMSVRKLHLRRRALDIAVRAIVAGFGSFVFFELFSSIAVAFDMGTYSLIIDWLPWTLSALLIAFASTIGTRVKLKKYVLGITVIIGLVSMYLWSFLFNGSLIFDIRVLLLFTCIFFAVGLAASVAEMAPKSERFFLNVKGAMKEMDIALFKWFINNPDEVITIGKSIDCSLQMSWDIKGQVAPIQAELRYVGGAIRLTAVEPGIVVDNNPLEMGRSVWLYHNTAFTIGDTTFTYTERDLS